jgi:hypothetical protein
MLFSSENILRRTIALGAIMVRKIYFSLFFLLGALYADQFAYIEPGIAIRAAEILLYENDVFLFCEPCNELQGTVVPVQRIEVIDVHYHGMREIELNGNPIDLAYTFVRRDGRWKNLAKELGLKPSDVSDELSFLNPKRKPIPDL